VRYRVLGPVEVVDGSPLRIRSPNQRALLAALLLSAGDIVSHHRLIDAIWDEPPATALESLRTYVYRLRGTLGDGAQLETRPGGYRLAAERGDIDARRFEDLLDRARGPSPDLLARSRWLQEALALWRGSPFPELADVPWALPEALRLEELRRVAIEERFALKLTLGEHVELVPEAAAFVAEHPLRERGHAHLLLALYRCGRQAEALERYRRFRAQLQEELGLDPPPPLVDLERRMLRRDPTLDRPQGGTTPRTDDVEARARPRSGGRRRAGSRPQPIVGLPQQRHPLIGRDEDVERVVQLLDEGNPVIVVGPGGVGKSRVALEVASRVADRFADGGWWWELSTLDAEREVEDALATRLGVRPGEHGSAAEASVAFLEQHEALLVIDNAEHVSAAIEAVVHRIAARCDGIAILVTSRRALDARAARIHRLPPLAIESGSEHGDAGDDRDRHTWPRGGAVGPAVALLLERGWEVRPDLPVEADEDRESIIEICRRLDGLPLALELAASRLRALNPTDLAARLADRLDLLSRPDLGSRPEPRADRHRALHATVDWSYHLLTAAEQRLFERLSVFAGPFTIEAAEAVAVDADIAPDDLLDLLTGLVDHSIVTVVAGAGPTRYTLLGTLRAFGRQRLANRAEEEPTRRLHARYHASLAEDAGRQVRSRDERLGVERLDRCLADLRAAHRWTLEEQEPDLGLRLVVALLPYALWRLRDEVLAWAAPTAAMPGADVHPLFPAVAGMAGWAQALRGDLEAAGRWARRGLAAVPVDHPERALVPEQVLMHVALWTGQLDTCREIGERMAPLADDPYELMPSYVPALALTYSGRAREALRLMDDVQARADRLGNPTMRCLAAYTRGEALLDLDAPRAVGPLEQASRLARQVDNRMLQGVVDVALASQQARHGDPYEALETFTGIIDRLSGGGDWAHLWTGLRHLVVVVTRLQEWVAASALLGAVTESPTAPPPYGEDEATLGAVRQRLEGELGSDAFRLSYERGAAMSGAQALELARSIIADLGRNGGDAAPDITSRGGPTPGACR
jgi:predicted ATPase/DNA-binding SARP family transcriptional activator